MHQDQNIDIHILGNGAIGSLWASHIANSGLNVAFIAKKEPLKSNTFDFIFECDEVKRNESIPLLAIEQLKSIKILLVCVKSYQLEQALKNISKSITPDSIVVLLQNGMGNQEVAEAILPHSTILLATNTHAAFRKHPNHIVYTGRGQTMIGSADNDRSLDFNSDPNADNSINKYSCITKPLNEALEPVTWQPNIAYALWRKLAINAVINPLTAHYNCRNGALKSNPEYYQHVLNLIDELLPVANHYCPSLKNETIFEDIQQVIENTANNFSSMHQDHTLGRKTEIEAITGYLIQCARKMNITLPQHQKLFHKIKKS